MRHRWIHLSGSLAALALSFSASSRAAATPETPSPGLHELQAQARYDAGAAAYTEGRYPDAVRLFREADRLEPSALLSFDVARAFEKMGDDAGALHAYRDYLRRATSVEEPAEVRRRIAALEVRLAERGVQQVTVVSTPSGATVAVDGAPVGVTPWTSELRPGSHWLRVHLEGHQLVERRIHLSASHALDVSVALVREPEGHRARGAPVASHAREESPGRARVAPVSSVRDAGGSKRGAQPVSTIGAVTLGTGGAALVGALVFELLRRDSEHRAQNETEQVRLAQDIDTMESRQVAARALAGTGASLSVIGVVLVLLGAREPAAQERSPAVRVQVTSTAASAAVWGRF